MTLGDEGRALMRRTRDAQGLGEIEDQAVLERIASIIAARSLGKGTASLTAAQLAAVEKLLSTSSPVYTSPSRAI